jgi:phage-related holin
MSYLIALRVWAEAHSNNFLAGVLIALGGYFAPVQNVVLVVMLAVIIDLITGIWASYTRGKGIKSRRLMRSIVKIVLYNMIIYLMFCIDKEMALIELHKTVAWLIVGFEVWSILENAARITDHRIFRILRRYMEDRVKETTGMDLNEKEITE